MANDEDNYIIFLSLNYKPEIINLLINPICITLTL